MKEIIITILFCVVIWLGNDNLNLRSQIKPFKEVLPENDVIVRLKCELFRKDSLTHNIEDFIQNEKDGLRFKRIYFRK